MSRLIRRILPVLLLLPVLFVHAAFCADIFPLEPPDTTSPRAALNSFLHYTDELYAAAVADEIEGKAGREFMQRASGCFDLSQVPPTLKKDVSRESVLMLREILDRIEIPELKDIPDKTEAERQNIRRWRIPHTEITIARVSEGPRMDEYLFTPETVRDLPGFYEEVRDLAYRKTYGGNNTGFYEQYIYSSGWMISQGFLQVLPEWMLEGVHGQAVWQWAALILVLGLALLIVGILGKWHMGRRKKIAGQTWRIDRLIFPCSAMFLCVGLGYIADDQINITGDIIRYLTMGLGILFSVFSALAIVIAGDIVMHGIISSARIKEEALDADVIKLVCRLITFALVFLLLYKVGTHFGIPVTAIFASAGIAGVAVALAARETLANFFGGISIFLDRPFKAGDYIVLSSGERGQVKAVGMRSTRLVTRDDAMITIPNSLITNGKVVNQSMPHPSFRIRIKIGIAYGTDINKVEAILMELAAANDLVIPDPEPRVRFRAFGDSALEFELLCWAADPEDRGKLTHQLNRAIYLRFGEEKIEIPFPQRDVHLHTS